MSMLFVELFGPSANAISEFAEDVRRLTVAEERAILDEFVRFERDVWSEAATAMNKKRDYRNTDPHLGFTHHKCAAIEGVMKLAWLAKQNHNYSESQGIYYILEATALALASRYVIDDEEYTWEHYHRLMRPWKARNDLRKQMEERSQ